MKMIFLCNLTNIYEFKILIYIQVLIANLNIQDLYTSNEYKHLRLLHKIKK